jgi:thioredoxin 2
MPVLVNPKICVDRDHCFAAGACPYGAFLHNPLKRTWEVNAEVCGDCPGPCLNFCDKDALRWGDDLVDLSLVRAELEGRMKPEQVAEAKAKHKIELVEAKKREEAAKKSAESLINLTRDNFEQEVLRSSLPVAVDCWADWCGPCKKFSPVFEAVAKQYAGVVKFAKLDTEAERALAAGLGVQSLPTVLLFYKGQIVNAVEGALPPAQFQEWIYRTLAAVRQYAAQLDSEAELAISSAVENLRQLDAIGDTTAPGLSPITAGETSPKDPTGPRPDPWNNPSKQPDASPKPEPESPGRGKRTSSGLYIP